MSSTMREFEWIRTRWNEGEEEKIYLSHHCFNTNQLLRLLRSALRIFTINFVFPFQVFINFAKNQTDGVGEEPVCSRSLEDEQPPFVDQGARGGTTYLRMSDYLSEIDVWFSDNRSDWKRHMREHCARVKSGVECLIWISSQRPQVFLVRWKWSYMKYLPWSSFVLTKRIAISGKEIGLIMVLMGLFVAEIKVALH